MKSKKKYVKPKIKSKEIKTNNFFTRSRQNEDFNFLALAGYGSAPAY